MLIQNTYSTCLQPQKILILVLPDLETKASKSGTQESNQNTTTPWGKRPSFIYVSIFLKLCFSHFSLINYKIIPSRHSCLLKTSYLNNSTKPTCIANIFQPNWPTINSPPVIGIGIFSPDFTAFSL